MNPSTPPESLGFAPAHAWRRLSWLWLCLAGLVTGNALATAPAAPIPPVGTLTRPAGAAIIPEQFLRRWDPVTLFFDEPTGPAESSPEDQPQRWVTLQPTHPGAYQWLDAHTLQFRPAQPWPALTRFTWRVGEHSHSLATLMESPRDSLPYAGAEDLEPLDSISLSFGEPLDPVALARMLRIELRPLPGLPAADANDGNAVRWLGAADFSVKTVERHSPSDLATYVLQLNQPIGPGLRVVVHLQLSLDAEDAASFSRIEFSTETPFRLSQAGCQWQSYPLTPAGVRYTPEQAMQCGSDNRSVSLNFSASPRDLGLLEVRNLVRFTPALEGFDFSLYDKELSVSGQFAPNTLYRVSVLPAAIQDQRGRTLEMSGASEFYVYFTPKPDFLRWQSNRGIVERHGPQMLPVQARGFDQVDLRVYPVDPLDRSFWPFPRNPVTLDEDDRPPGPGEEPLPFRDPGAYPTTDELARQLKALGSPPVSLLVDLPGPSTGSGAGRGNAARFGLDLAPHFAKIAGAAHAPGTYLVGLRPLDGSTQRAWVRVQVTDLSLSTVEEPGAVRFAVTSLSTGQPLAGAEVRVEGAESGPGVSPRWSVLFSGKTDAQGLLHWLAPGDSHLYRNVRRISVSHADDSLVLDPSAPPERYADNHWQRAEMNWLQWAFEPLRERLPPTKQLCHLFTERPVYRPEDNIHVKGYLRSRAGGEIAVSQRAVKLVVQGPNDLVWRYPLEVNQYGSFYHLFDEKTEPTGAYTLYLEEADGSHCGEMSVLKDAYRIPTFEVQLESPDPVPLDQAFDVKLIAKYYAGGMLARQPVRWRVAQFPYTWTPVRREGFLYSSEARFSGAGRFDSAPVLERNGETDDGGAALLGLDPGNETSAQPRTYVIEATVTGKDDQTVTNTRRVNAVPAVALGVKVARYLERAREISPEIIAVGPDGALKTGEKITLRLSKREWHSHLQVGDFSHGEAKYITEAADRLLHESVLHSAAQALNPTLALDGAGVYLLELETYDKLGRAQRLSVDFYVSGDETQTWERPPPQQFKPVPDRASYQPGDTAHIVLESPYQHAQALAVVEAPEGVRYQWVAIRNGAATFDLLMQNNFVPRVPVHFVLMRGRNGEILPGPGARLDLGKPSTLAATAWLTVEPVEHQLKVALEYPPKAKPGDTVPVTIKLSDRHGQPLPGEVTLWLVNQAVLALGKEQRLEILPDFITPVRSWLGVLDTRNFTLGWLPFEEMPGGDSGGPGDWLDKVTVRKRFDPVPYYNPGLVVGPDGTLTVQVQLPDDLTNFKLRAKAVSGPDRFGVATGEIQVRLPVLVQPALPRFVRPGDRFSVAALARVVEGAGGPARASLQVQGLTLEGPASAGAGVERGFELDPLLAQRLDFRVTVPPSQPSPLAPPPEGPGVRITLAVERLADQARDAVQVTLPLRADRDPVVWRELRTLAPGESFDWAALDEPLRPGSLRRELLVSNQPALIRMAAGLSYLLEYPHGCTEQRLSRARAALAFQRLHTALAMPAPMTNIDHSVRDVLDWLPGVVNEHNLVSYWPGGTGYVSLTAWVLEFLVEARNAGFSVDAVLFERLSASLKQALRSDYSQFIDGEAYSERVMALRALAAAGQADTAYAAELARRSQYLNLESLAQVVHVLSTQQTGGAAPTLQALDQKLWDGVIFRLHQGQEIYGGLQTDATPRNGLILPSETRTLAELSRALNVTQSGQARLQVLVDALVRLGQGDGWGSTQANAAAALALAEVLKTGDGGGFSAELQSGGQTRRLDSDTPLLSLNLAASTSSGQAPSTGSGQAAGRLSLAADAPRPLVVRLDTRYTPQADGSQVQPVAKGFVLSREALQIQADGAPPLRTPLREAGQTLELTVGAVVEEHLELVNPADRHYVALVVPLAAGVEPLNPRLATAPPEAAPAGSFSLAPSYAAYLDDSVAFYYDSLPKGTYHFYFRTRASVAGEFIQPAARAEMMYDQAVFGLSAGARVRVTPPAP